MVIALVCSIIAFKKTTVFSSVVRTAFLAALAICSVRSAIIFTAVEKSPDTVDQSYNRFMDATMMLGGKACVAGFFILSLFVPMLFITSVFAVIKLVRNPHTGEKIDGDGGWNV